MFVLLEDFFKKVDILKTSADEIRSMMKKSGDYKKSMVIIRRAKFTVLVAVCFNTCSYVNW